MDNRQMQFQLVIPFTKIVKYLIYFNVGVWFLGQVIIEQYFLPGREITGLLGLVPADLINNFFIWQPLTYMFLHSLKWPHIVFNMLLLWWLGAELEQRWGSRFFLSYYLVCGVGAGLIYVISMAVYSLITGSLDVLVMPVIGASGAVFGLMLAYGIIFGDRIIYFMLIFPMKARIFIIILGLIEVVSLLNTGVTGGEVANLAHLGGIVVGYLYLIFWTRFSGHKWKGKAGRDRRGLRLVVNKPEEKQGPRFWN